ncbi:hypothetical protein PHLCEN_2v11976 [Hermanssonia centrifuga]|uniref:Uncharacterized protein n=1 Tax=Hermanssonia centrifuga TaxID=98765 RepID=A0A2R6NIP4_9APHY|nr:hypothetical protein PHLCEN_2v11976 [Hermanssonia centrifuga]
MATAAKNATYGTRLTQRHVQAPELDLRWFPADTWETRGYFEGDSIASQEAA